MLLKTPNNSGGGPGQLALPELHRRLKWVALIAIGAFVLLVGRLWQLQVMRARATSSARSRTSSRSAICRRCAARFSTARHPARGQPAVVQPLRDAEVDDARGEGRVARMLGLGDDEIARIGERLEVGKKPRSERFRSSSSRIRAAIAPRRSSSRPARSSPASRSITSRIATTRRATSRRHSFGYMTQMRRPRPTSSATRATTRASSSGRYGLDLAWEELLRGRLPCG